MKYISYSFKGNDSLGVIFKDKIFDLSLLSKGTISNNMIDFLTNFESNHSWVKLNIKGDEKEYLNIADVVVNPPISRPHSFRDAYAFRQHVAAGRKSRGLEMIPEYDKFPVFYFSNHNSIIGPGCVEVEAKHLNKLDFELEIGILISKKGKNIKSKDAHNYIAGFMIMNDWSARAMQFEEMKLNLGPAKGKDFATSIGPYLVTPDELDNSCDYYMQNSKYDLEMKAFINNVQVSSDNMKNMSWSFSEIIERASYGVTLFPGDLIGSGTCATGCMLENNQTKNTDIWLKNGDIVRLSIEKLGTLENKIKLV